MNTDAVEQTILPKHDKHWSPQKRRDTKVRQTRHHSFAAGRLTYGTLPLLGFTALNELSSNLVFVVLMDSANTFGAGARSIGTVLIIQCMSQLLLGSLAGGIADRLGTSRTAAIGTIAQALLAVGLIMVRSIAFVYILAVPLMLARLLIIPARLALVRRVSDRTRLVGVNTAIEVLTGAGLFLGPSIAAMLVLLTDVSFAPAAIAALTFLASALPALLIKAESREKTGVDHEQHKSIFMRVKTAMGYVRNRRLIRIFLLCRIHSTMLWAAVMPLLTPLSRKFGFEAEGTGVFVAAIGLGSLIGPLSAPVLFRKMKISTAMLIFGLLGPVAAMTVALAKNVSAVLTLGLVAFISLACAGLKVIVNTVFQRLTPDFEQGSVFGTEQTVLGIGWTVALAVVTVLLSPAFSGLDLTFLFLLIGGGGLLMFSACWFASRSELRNVAVAEHPERLENVTSP